MAGPFVGVHGDALIVAGGANFPAPVWESDKVWLKDVYVLLRDSSPDRTPYRWFTGFQLDRPIAYGASASTPHGVVCVGGNDATRTYADAFLLRWNDQTKSIERRELPPLPEPVAYASADAIGEIVYVAGGTSGTALETATRNFWSIDLSRLNAGQMAWRKLPSWPGPPRAFSIMVAQQNGQDPRLYLMSGRRVDERGQIQFLRDVYEFSPGRYTVGSDNNAVWRRRTDVPRCVMAGTGIAIGRNQVFVLSGADGSLFDQANALKGEHPGFPLEVLVYDTVGDTWTTAGTMPANHVTTTAVRWGPNNVDAPIIIPSGEIRPRVRSPKIWSVRPVYSGQ